MTTIKLETSDTKHQFGSFVVLFCCSLVEASSCQMLQNEALHSFWYVKIHNVSYLEGCRPRFSQSGLPISWPTRVGRDRMKTTAKSKWCTQQIRKLVMREHFDLTKKITPLEICFGCNCFGIRQCALPDIFIHIPCYISLI